LLTPGQSATGDASTAASGNICLLQASSLTRRVNASGLAGGKFHFWTSFHKATPNKDTRTALMQAGESRKSVGREAVVSKDVWRPSKQSKDMFSSKTKVIIFVLSLLVIVSIVTYMLILRPKLAAKPCAAPCESGESQTSRQPNRTAHFGASPATAHFGAGAADADEDDEEVVNQDEAQFCPALVVPAGCECALVLPYTTVGEKPREVLDPSGVTVLRIVPKAGELWQVELATPEGEVLAWCSAAPESSTGSCEYHFHQAGSGEHFAKLVQDEDNYHIIFVEGSRRLHLSCLSEHLIDLTDESGKLLASLEPAIGASASASDDSSENFRLRVAPLVDAGLALCGVLCISHWRKSSK